MSKKSIDAAVKPAREVYAAAVKPAWEVYDAAVKQARKK